MSFRSQAVSKLRRFIFTKHQQYHSLSSTTAAARRSHLTNLRRSAIGLCLNRSIYTEEDYNKARYYEPCSYKEDEMDRQRRREERIKAGLDTADIDTEENEDFFGVQALIDKIDKDEESQSGYVDWSNRRQKRPSDLNRFEEDTESESDDDDERFSKETKEPQEEEMEMKLKKHEELLENFAEAETLDDAFKWMEKINKFEEKFLTILPEYRVIGKLMNRLKETTDLKEKFLLQDKLNRQLRLVEFREKFNPKDPANYGLINVEQAAEISGAKDEDKKKRYQENREEEKQFVKEDDKDDDKDDDELEFDAEKEKDDILLENLAAMDKKLEEKLTALDHTFGKKGKLLEAEIRDLAEESSALTEKRRRPQYRIGFDVYPIYLNRTCKVTKGGQVKSYTAIVACGNYNGVVGFAKAKGPGGSIAYQKAYEKCFQNLHTIERHEEHTIAHAVQAEYKKTKVYLWPARTQTGMKAGKTVQAILNLAGFKNIKCKVVGSRNPHNTIKALFKALNAIEIPEDVQEKFGRTVV